MFIAFYFARNLVKDYLQKNVAVLLKDISKELSNFLILRYNCIEFK